VADQAEQSIRVEKSDSGVVITPTGEIDLSHSPNLRQALLKALEGRPKRLVINLEKTPYMDSSGVATLVEAMQVSMRNSTKLVLCGLQVKVRSIFEIARLDAVFTIVDGPADALTR
jgi:anti-sigma B factor antagonist